MRAREQARGDGDCFVQGGASLRPKRSDLMVGTLALT